jgi:hypothetical protein
MLGQKNLKGSPTSHLTDNLQHVAGDIADLCELQAELFATDGRATVRQMIVPIVLGIVGAVVLATSSLLAFTALALWLHVAWNFSLGGAFLIAAVGALLFGLLCVVLGYLIVRWRRFALARSWHELKLNLAWTRRALFGAPKKAA